jgi:exopolysaccharide biosynthesis polyprenyl glycosylphosphotransferase
LKNKGIIFSYVLADWIAAAFSWACLYFLRKKFESVNYDYDFSLHTDRNFFAALALIPLAWICFYAMWGMYSDVMRRHRLREIGQVLATSLIGNIVIFFLFLLDDELPNYYYYYTTFGFLLLAHLCVTLALRLFITSRTVKKIQSRKWGFPTVIVGGNARAVQLLDEINTLKKSPGFLFKGYLKINGADEQLSANLPLFGKYHSLPTIIEEHQIEEVILSVESGDHQELESILALLENYNVRISIIPDTFDILSGNVKMTSVFGVPLIRLNTVLMPSWQFSIKRIIDIVFSAYALAILAPILFVIGILVKATSTGPIFFFQERIGRNGIPFRIIKFRSMFTDAEKLGPQLSSTNDYRITKIGRFLRKTRLDELPQFWNVLAGDMALVGPRPERQFYIDQISKINPHYHKLHRIRPGITSWGQVKYGYAENVDQMVQRLRYDLLYLENMSLAMDIKILFYTIVIVLKGSGK